MNEKIKIIRQHGKTARGQKEILKHLSGQKLTFKQAIYAKCYDCMNYFSDGKIDCKIPSCPLYPFMAYKEDRAKINIKHIRQANMCRPGRPCFNFIPFYVWR